VEALCPLTEHRGQAVLYAFVKASFDVRCPYVAPALLLSVLALSCPLCLSSLPALPSPASLQRVPRSPSPLPRQPEKTLYIDNERVTFNSDKDFQQVLTTRWGAIGLKAVS